jgi:hypothetical protein
MYTYQKVKCEKCGVEQEVNSKEYTECPNGCYRVRLSYSGWSYSYNTDNGRSACLNRDIYKEKKYIEENDYIDPDEEILELIEKIESYEDKLNYRANVYKSFREFENNPNVLWYFEFSYYDVNTSGERTEFKIHIEFMDEHNNFYGKRDDEIKEIKNRMKHFIEVLDKLVNKEFDINDRKYIYDNIDYEDASSEQLNLTDDTYYF